MSIKYELSLWRDLPRVNSISEEKVEIIGATDMSYGGRAQNIKLRKDYNGRLTLTFDLPVKYFDFQEGKDKINPLTTKIQQQSKLKLWRNELWWNPFAKHNGTNNETGCEQYTGEWVQGRWYDFIVVNHTEKRSKKKLVYSYTCNSLFINELSRNGYDLEFVPDTDIMSANGMGTAHTLAERIIDGTDWKYIKTEVFPDYKEEFNAASGETVRTPVATDQIEFSAGLDRYVYCYNMDMSGKNLFDCEIYTTNPEDPYDHSGYGGERDEKGSPIFSGKNRYKRGSNTEKGNEYISFDISELWKKVGEGSKITLSFDAKIDKKTSTTKEYDMIVYTLGIYGIEFEERTVAYSADWKTCSFLGKLVFKPTDSGNSPSLSFFCPNEENDYGSENYPTIKNIKIEVGHNLKPVYTEYKEGYITVLDSLFGKDYIFNEKGQPLRREQNYFNRLTVSPFGENMNIEFLNDSLIASLIDINYSYGRATLMIDLPVGKYTMSFDLEADTDNTNAFIEIFIPDIGLDKALTVGSYSFNVDSFSMLMIHTSGVDYELGNTKFYFNNFKIVSADSNEVIPSYKNYIYGYNKTNIVTSYADKLLCYTSGEMVDSNNNPVNEATLLNSTSLWQTLDGAGTISTVMAEGSPAYPNYYRLEFDPINQQRVFYNSGVNDKVLERGKNYILNLSLVEVVNGNIYFEVYDKINSTDASRTPVISFQVKGDNTENNCFTNSYYFTIPSRITEPYIAIRTDTKITIKGLMIYEWVGSTIEIDDAIKKALSQTIGYSGLISGFDPLKNLLSGLLSNPDLSLNQDASSNNIWLPIGTMAQNNFDNGTNVYFIETFEKGEYKQTYLNIKDSDVTKITSYNTDKRRAISGSKSNRYSLLETVSKTFFCFTRFMVEHDKDGRIVLENGRPKKYFTFTSELGRKQFNGFTYGVNLDGVERKIDSNELVTKVYVESIDNQHDDNGIITIQNSTYNNLGENFFYNFNHYTRQGILKGETFAKDYIELIDYVKSKNVALKQLNENYINKKNLRDTLKTSLDTNLLLTKANLQSANEELTTIRWDAVWNEIKDEYPILDTDLIYPNINWNSIISKLEVTDISGLSELFSSILFYLSQTDEGTLITGGLDADTIENSFRVVQALQSDYNNKQATIKKEQGQVSDYNIDIAAAEDTQARLIKEKNNKIKWFENKYRAYILEGQWSGKDYIEPDTYYLDATRAMSTSCMPKVSYSINALDLSKVCNPFNPEDTTWGADFIYDVGDTTYIKDEELFGSIQQKAMVATMDIYVDVDKPDDIELRNFETRFEELFQSIAAAVTTLQLNENIYGRAENFDPTGVIDVSILQKSFDENRNLVISSANNEVVQDNKGLTISDKSGTGEVLRAVAGGIFLSNDNGQTFTAGLTAKGFNASLITAGQIDTSKIVIRSSETPEYVFNSQGLTAYRDKVKNVNGKITKDTQSFVRFDQFGLWMTDKGENFVKNWWLNNDLGGKGPTEYIESNSIFSLTEKGFKYSQGGLTLGLLESNNGENIYGLSFVKDGNENVRIDSDGKASFKGKIEAEKGKIANYLINGSHLTSGDVGLSSSPDDWAFWAGSASSNKADVDKAPFRVGHGGYLHATNANIEGTITADEGKIGGFSIGTGYLGNMTGGHGIWLESNPIEGNCFINCIGTSGEFKVYQDGKIYANGGQIGGLTIDGSNGLKFKDAINDQYTYICPAGASAWVTSASGFVTIAFGIGTLGATNFGVTPQGKLYATDAVISGTLKAGSMIADGNITSSNGTGFFLKSKANYNYLLINDSSTQLFHNTYGQFNFSSSAFKKGDNTYQALLYCKTGYKGAFDGNWHVHGNFYNSSGSTAISSDINKKNSIEHINSKYESMFDNLKSVTYKYNEGTSNRTHIGFIAQEVKSAMDTADINTIDFAGLVIEDRNTEHEEWYIRYEEFIALNTWQIQKAKARISALETEVSSLKQQLSNLLNN